MSSPNDKLFNKDWIKANKERQMLSRRSKKLSGFQNHVVKPARELMNRELEGRFDLEDWRWEQALTDHRK